MGGHGTGKTWLATQFVLRTQTSRTAGKWFDVDKWDGHSAVGTWLKTGPRTAELLDAGKIHPVIDGVDRLAPGLRAGFLDQVRDLPFPVLLTGRPMDIDDRFPIIQAQPPPLHATLGAWPEIAQDVHDDPTGPPALALADPVNRYLLTKNYAEKPGAAAELVDRTVFPDAAAIERHLSDNARRGPLDRLRALSAFAQTSGTEGIAWWTLPNQAPRAAFTTVAAITGALGGVAAEIIAGHTALSWTMTTLARVVVGIVIGLALFAFTWQARRPRSPRMLRTEFRLGRWTAAQDENTMLDPKDVLVSDLVVAIMRFAFAGIPALFLLLFLRIPIASDALKVLALAVGVAGFSGSASFRLGIAYLSSSASRYAWEFVEEPPAELLTRTGGRLYFRDESIQQRLAGLRLDWVEFDEVGARGGHLAVLRGRLVEQACLRADVAGMIEPDALPAFKADVVSDVDKANPAIRITTAAARERYFTAKANYVAAALGSSLSQAVGLAFLSRALVVPGALLSVFSYLIAVALWHGVLWLSLTISSVIVAGWAAWYIKTRAIRSTSAGLGLVIAMTAAGVLLPRQIPFLNRGWLLAGACGALLCFAGWRLAKRFRIRTGALKFDDPDRWPPRGRSTAEDDARKAAQDALRDWYDAIVERGIMPLVRVRLVDAAVWSYEKVLPTADVRRLGDITDVTEYVPTETSERLRQIIDTRSGGAIGISGSRGAGKSTLLKMFGELRFGARPNDVTLVVPAPTNYGSRDFLVHLYATLCRKVIGSEEVSSRRVRVWWFVALGGVVTALVAWRWDWLTTVARLVPPNWQRVTVGAGLAVTAGALGFAWWQQRRARRRTGDPLVAAAKQRLDGLRFVETTTVTTSVTVKPPAVAEFGGSQAKAKTGQVKTLPELVDDLRDFLRLLTRDKPGTRVVLCVDELDKIGTAAEAERFLNDIKAIFGVEGCFFLVAVSSDALASFSARSLAVRTAFDSAFDDVVTVGRFELSDTRRLLVQRVSRLPEPFVWLCHALSSGLPRDLNRIVRDLYYIHTKLRVDDLATLSRELVAADLRVVTDGLAARVADRFDHFAVTTRRHIAEASRLDVTSLALLNHQAPNDPRTAGDELNTVLAQLQSYLTYAAALLRAFGDNADTVIGELRNTPAEPIDYLALARVSLSADPGGADAYLRDWTEFEDRRR
ncbi:P-loop NTPase fold protein [Actinokineospora inagensis]|uniref:P-loop NTPase fold protein n=1 Tax=Actinokineospora inagensis TaxID=103730 RepID=UPI000417A0EA|nr:P-loop NTPase fold protein [Actinokineospora inagensis]